MNEQLIAELAVLTEAIHLLTKSIIATEKEVGCFEDEHSKRLETLLREWKLEDTGFVRLYNACMQMKQTLRLTAIEADEAVNDVNKTNKLLYYERHKSKKMKAAMMNLCEENHVLRERNQELEIEKEQHQKEMNVVSRSLRKFVKYWRKEREDFQMNNENIFVMAHEERMRASHDYKAMGTEKCADCSESVSTIISSTSLITDDTCATLRLENHEKPNFDPKLDPNSNSRYESLDYEITFKKSPPGIQFKPFDIDEENKTIFLVCAYKGFRGDNGSRKPSFGARLVGIDKINQEEIENWAMKDLVSFLNTKNGPLKLIFRDEDIPPEKIEVLKKRAKELGFNPK
mmetsp:Transcript_5646/g.6929  ORF Transcript_5646/g.6929 Transcript_5646/m.6929 type:complete len:344 (+) Transcript_5646:3-1034(+)